MTVKLNNFGYNFPWTIFLNEKPFNWNFGIRWAPHYKGIYQYDKPLPYRIYRKRKALNLNPLKAQMIFNAFLEYTTSISVTTTLMSRNVNLTVPECIKNVHSIQFACRWKEQLDDLHVLRQLASCTINHKCCN